MAKGNKSEQRKRILLVALGGLFVFAVIYNLFLSPPSRPGRKPSNSNAPAPTAPTATTSQPGTSQPSPPKATGQPEEIVALLMQDLTPLDLRHSTTGGPVEPDKERGDATVFAYYVPPPPPPVPPPPPPPITLTGVTPASAVAGTPRRITLIVVANIVPTDAQLMFDGGVRPSRRLNEHQIATDLEPSDYASARPITITIKSASDPKMFSTPTTFSVQPAPEPQFRYIGRLGEQGLFELMASKEIKRLGRGDSILNQWRIDAITDQGVEVTLTQYDIKRRVPLTEKTR
ncbi:MAG: hypothetical protein ACJ74G_23610 [Blastocatellia bacterium]